MNDSNVDDLDLDAMMREIRAEVARRKHLADPTATASTSAAPPPSAAAAATPGAAMSLPRLPEATHPFETKERYTLEDFLRFHDEEFVRNAYLGVLRRGPDGAGCAGFLTALREARLSKTEIVGRIRFSREGRAVGVPIAGLAVPFALRTLRRVPVLGRLVGIVQYVVRLPEIVRNHERLEAVVFHREQQLNRHLNHVHAQIEGAVTLLERRAQDAEEGQATARQVAERIADIEAAFAQIRDALAGPEGIERKLAALDQRKSDRTDVASLKEAGEAGMHAMQSLLSKSVQEVHARIADVQRSVGNDIVAATAQPLARLDDHDRELVRLASGLREQQRKVAWMQQWSRAPQGSDAASDGAALDAFYVDFEDHFRGTTEDIRERVSIYLPAIRAAGIGGPEAPVVDLGSGRGEWLQLLREQGIHARGVDLNRELGARCREHGLHVVEADAVSYLTTQPADSLGAVTAFHLVEHVSFADLLTLVDESLRALRPDGLLVLETPNPENLVVGACNFYLDPTHRNPLPPAMLHFVAEARGFDRVETLRLHPLSGAPRGPDGLPLLPQGVEAMLYGPQDYAILARKPRRP